MKTLCMTDTRRTLMIIAILVASTLLAYGQVATHKFVNFDDDVHVYNNVHVRTGLSVENIKWSFGIHGPSQWHPLAWLSHQLDCELFKLKPRGHHLTNLALHVANAVLLFLALKSLTGAKWPSAVVAALFALHPLNVESVAWISERRNLLSTLFWILTLLSYSAYVRRPGVCRYLVVAVMLALGLMSKPMLVTLPFVLLLLDYWPLGRLQLFSAERSGLDHAESLPQPVGPARSLRFLIIEKMPLLVLSAVSSVLTIWCQQSAQVVTTLKAIPMPLRGANALVAYSTYLRKMFWPSDLSVFYPHPAIVDADPWSTLAGPAIAASVILIAITFFAVSSAKRRPYFVVGWFWYLGTLVPVIGLMQVGEQQMADRYTYVPFIGLFLAIIWLVPSPGREGFFQKVALPGCGVLTLALLMAFTWRQTAHWKNSITLFEHALSVNERNHWAHNNLGLALANSGRLVEAVDHYRQAIEIDPEYALAYHNYGTALYDLNLFAPAVHEFQQVVRFRPEFAEAHVSLGAAFGKQGNWGKAVYHLQQALFLEPDYAIAHNNLGMVFEQLNKPKLAIEHFRHAVRLQPNYQQAQQNLRRVLDVKQGM